MTSGHYMMGVVTLALNHSLALSIYLTITQSFTVNRGTLSVLFKFDCKIRDFYSNEKVESEREREREIMIRSNSRKYHFLGLNHSVDLSFHLYAFTQSISPLRLYHW